MTEGKDVPTAWDGKCTRPIVPSMFVGAPAAMSWRTVST